MPDNATSSDLSTDTGTASSNISVFTAVKFQIKTVPKSKQYLSKIRLPKVRSSYGSLAYFSDISFLGKMLSLLCRKENIFARNEISEKYANGPQLERSLVPTT